MHINVLWYEAAPSASAGLKAQWRARVYVKDIVSAFSELFGELIKVGARHGKALPPGDMSFIWNDHRRANFVNQAGQNIDVFRFHGSNENIVWQFPSHRRDLVRGSASV